MMKKQDKGRSDSAGTSGQGSPWQRLGLPTRFPEYFQVDPVTRRSVLKFMGASMAMTFGLAGCDRKPVRPIVSRVEGPEYMKPGVPLYYSSTWIAGHHPYGMVVKTLEGRPVGVAGDPDCPVARGAASLEMQAALLSLYDPARLRRPRMGGREVEWDLVDREVDRILAAPGQALLLTGPDLGPAQRRLIEAFCRRHRAGHLVYDPLADRERRLAWQQVYGRPGIPVPRLDRARVILSLEADFLGAEGEVISAARGFAAGRRPGAGAMEMNRLWVAEGGMSLTGSNADHRIRLAPTAHAGLVSALLAALAGDRRPLAQVAEKGGLEPKLLSALADDLAANRGQSLVLAGPHLPGHVHCGVALLNEKLGAHGRTLAWEDEPHRHLASSPAEIRAALAGEPKLVIMLGINPAYDWPGGGFGQLLARAGTTLVHALDDNETAALGTMALPSAHPLESWGDALVAGGRHALAQPVIAPLFRARQEYQSLFRWTFGPKGAGAADGGAADWHDWVKSGFRSGATGPDDPAWEAIRRRGYLGVARRRTPPAVRADRVGPLTSPDSAPGLQVVLVPHHSLGDGRHAGNGWLQELPHPVSRIVWDNPAEIAPALARRHRLEEGDLVTLTAGNATLQVPVLIQPGTADGVIRLPLGGGRTKAGPVGTGRGVNPASLRDPGGRLLLTGVKLTRAGGRVPLVRTQKYFSMHGRPLALDGDLQEYRDNPHFVDTRRHLPEPVKIHEEQDFSTGEKWGMAIDLSACTGCGLCITACQAENNIPVVGKEECAKGREMHWVRVDLYHDDDEEDPVFHRQPVICQHCDNAPCETVCPVQATSQSPDGLNEMTYNRCVGTRYCANNCPYKVRRFNFFNYQKRNLRDPVQELAHNPEVTVRSVGVMEKCSFCIQRINAARFTARNEGRRVADGEVRPACLQACPAGAIVFGDLNDPESAVARLRRHDRSYFLLEELNTKPALAYLARVRNPHPRLAVPRDAGHHGGH